MAVISICGSIRTLGLLSFACAISARAETPLSETRSTLEKWVEVRQLISKARNDWQTDKETIEQTIQLFERELKSVEEQMSKVSTNSTQVDRERLEAETLNKSSNEALERARQFAAGFEEQVQKQVPQLPVPLQEIIKQPRDRVQIPTNAKLSRSAKRLLASVSKPS
jgi:septal ring factor EnvC (AmiA/AmiB activator)